MTAASTIALTVLTGFLGAGKTTLLNRLLKSPDMADTAVIINEFGDVGIDHALVDSSSEGIIELASGCLCCTVRGQLVDTLADIVARCDDGRIGPLARVVIETTGLADPAPVLHAIMAHPVLLRRFRLAGVVTVVDAVNGAATLDAHEEAVKQVAIADRLYLTKGDLAAPDSARRLIDRLRHLAPYARLIEAGADWSAADLLDTGLWSERRRTADARAWLADDGTPDDHVCGPACDHANHRPRLTYSGTASRHDQRIRSFTLTCDTPITSGALDFFLDLLRSTQGPRLLRMKAIVQMADDPARPVVLHAVQHVLHPPARLPAWPDADHRTRMVFITRDLDEAFVRRMFATITGQVAADTPDLQAIHDNPLAIGGFSGRFA